MKRTLTAALVMTALLGTVTTASASGTATDTTDTPTLQEDADALLKQGAPGVLAEVSTPEGNTKIRSGYGNTTTKTPVPWDAKFRIGSNTKTFVATTLLQLVGEGKLSLDDTIDRWLPGVVTGNGNDGSKITIRQMLQHTSGIPEYTSQMTDLFLQDGFEKNRFKTYKPEQLVAKAMELKPSFAPGTDWSYSNTNYILAGLVIEKVTGNTWQHEVHTRIAQPLGLNNTFAPGTFPFIPDPHAIGYERFPDNLENPTSFGPPIDATYLNPSWGEAAGEIISTTKDINTFFKALINGELLGDKELTAMTDTVPAKAIDPAWPGARYGLGLMWIPNSCGGSWSHGGDIQGFKTRNGVTMDGSRSVTVTINTDSLILDNGKPAPIKDVTIPLIDHALCGTN